MPLYLVSTPIGNLDDLPPRALSTLREADIIAAEDTRHTGLLLSRFGLSKRLISFHDHNEGTRSAALLPLLQEGKSIALVSDAGTPGIADPAFNLVRLAVENGITVIPIPGPSAVITALMASGLPTDRFVFENFLPVKPGKRRHKLESLKDETRTIIFYESPYRLTKTLRAMQEIFGDIPVVVARELTKKFETFHRGPITTLLAHFDKEGVKGEITVLFSLKGQNTSVPEEDAEEADEE